MSEQTEERIHHPYSPSTLQSLEACPCFEQKQGEVHVRAIAGTKAHKLTETGEDDLTLDDADAEAAAECMDFYNSRKQLMEDARTQWAVERNQITAPPILELTETYLPVDDEIIEINTIDRKDYAEVTKFLGTTAGYFDRVIIDHTGTYAEAFDWKFGDWAIEKCENNLQAIAYVLGLFKKFPRLESIRFFFKQPALALVSDHLFTREQIPALLLRVRVVVERSREARAQKNFSSANPVIPACLFCKHVGVCPAVTSYACRVGSKFAPLIIPESITPTMVQDPANTGLAMKLAQVLKVWSEAMRSVTADRVLRGAPLPDGYEMRSRDGSRKVTDEFKFRMAALDAGLTPSEYEATKDVSIGAVEKAISDKTPRGSKKEAIQTFKRKIEDAGDIVERGSPAVFLQAKNKSDD